MRKTDWSPLIGRLKIYDMYLKTELDSEAVLTLKKDSGSERWIGKKDTVFVSGIGN